MAGVVEKLPQHLQLRVLSMLDDKNFAAVTGLGPAEDAATSAADRIFMQATSQRFEPNIALEALKEKGIAVFDEFMGSDAVAGILDEARQLFDDGRMRKAGMGRGDSAWTDVRARGDDMVWLNEVFEGAWAGVADANSVNTLPEPVARHAPQRSPPNAHTLGSPKGRNTSPARRLSIENLKRGATEFTIPDAPASPDSLDDETQEEENEESKWIKGASVALGRVKAGIEAAAENAFPLNKATFQLARYADGARYVKHRDVSAKCPDRRLTCIYYFNDGWKEECGGALRLHLPSGPLDVAPRPDRLVLFLPDIEHEVLPSHCERFALSGWMYGPRSLRGDSPAATPQGPMGASLSDSDSPGGSPIRPFGSKNRRALRIVTENPDLDTIFVSMVAYRDPEAQHTICEMFDKAACPERVYVGLVTQADQEEDAACFTREIPRQYSGNVAEVRVHWSEARGPCWARHLAQRLYSRQKYYLQIDSHMRFVEHWDRMLIDQLKLCPSPKPVLSTYPAGYELEGAIPEVGPPTVLCATEFGQEGMLRIAGKILRAKPTAPQPSLFWAAGFSFSYGTMIRDVPYDPALKYLFFGEEMSMLARMWTKGYDVFLPTTSIVFHLWSREYRHTFSKDVADPHKLHLRSLRRARFTLGYAPDAHQDCPADDPTSQRKGVSGADCGPDACAATSHSQRPMHINCCALLDLLSRRKGDADDAIEATSDATSGAGVGEQYGLGKDRSLEALYEHLGVDFSTMTLQDRAKRGGMPEGSLI